MNAMVMVTILVGGLAAGDAGETSSGDVGAVCVDFEGEWKGTWQVGRGEPHRIELNLPQRGQDVPTVMTRWGTFLGRNGLTEPCSVVVQGEGQVKVGFPQPVVGFSQPVCEGIYRLKDQRLYICFSHRAGKRPTSFVPGPDEELWVLRPVQPIK